MAKITCTPATQPPAGPADAPGAPPAPGLGEWSLADEASVTGDETLTLSGPSWVASSFVVDPNDPDAEVQMPLQIGMTDFSGGGVSGSGLMFTLDGPLETGPVDLAPQDDFFLRPRATLIVGDNRTGTYADAASGTLTITRADSAVVAGTFRFVTEEARTGPFDFDPDGPMGGFEPFAVTVEGSFEADVLRASDRSPLDWPYPVIVPRPLP